MGLCPGLRVLQPARPALAALAASLQLAQTSCQPSISAAYLPNHRTEQPGGFTQLAAKHWRSIEGLVADALRDSGADLVVASPNGDLGADIAVWSDVLEPFVGNPLLVEVKGAVKGKTDVSRAMWQLAEYVGASGSRWGVLLYGVGPEFDEEIFVASPPNILVLSIRSLLERLRQQAFPELIRDLRNRRVHGVR